MKTLARPVRPASVRKEPPRAFDTIFKALAEEKQFTEWEIEQAITSMKQRGKAFNTSDVRQFCMENFVRVKSMPAPTEQDTHCLPRPAEKVLPSLPVAQIEQSAFARAVMARTLRLSLHALQEQQQRASEYQQQEILARKYPHFGYFPASNFFQNEESTFGY